MSGNINELVRTAITKSEFGICYILKCLIYSATIKKLIIVHWTDSIV